MKVGLDFDGVIIDVGKLKSESARRLYGIYIPPERFKKDIVVGSGILTLGQYKYLQKQIYDSNGFGLKMEPVKDVLEIIPNLQVQGFDLKIISSRIGNGIDIAKKWIEKYNLNIPIIGAGWENNKAIFCKGLDVYIDDDLDKLEPLIDIVRYRFLFSWGYNKDVELDNIAHRIESWQHFYDELHKLKKIK